MHALLMHYIIINANFCLLCFEGYCVKRPHWIIIMIPVIIKKYNCLLSYVVSRVCIACTVITVSSVSICLFNNKKKRKKMKYNVKFLVFMVLVALQYLYLYDFSWFYLGPWPTVLKIC